MAKYRVARVRVIRTQSLERDKAGSRRRKNSKGKSNRSNNPAHRQISLLGNGDNKNDHHQMVKASSRQNSFLENSPARKNINESTIRVIHLDSTSTLKSTTRNTNNNPLKSCHSTQSIKNGSTTKNTNQNSSASAASPSSTLHNTFDIHTDNNDIDALSMVECFHNKPHDNIRQKSLHTPTNLSWEPTNSNNPFVNQEVTKTNRRRRRRAGCLPYSPLCMALCGLATILLLSAIAAIIVALLNLKKTTTTSTTISTASLTTVTTTTGTTQTTTSSTTSSSTTTSTTTTTRPVCGTSCLNQTWINSSLLFAKWKFENNYLDEANQYNGTGINNPAFVAGYVGQAVSFAFNTSQMVSSSYIPLGNKSYSIDAWIYPTALINIPHQSICGICTAPSTDWCLHTTVRYANSTYYLYHGFYGDDTNSNTQSVLINQWIHAAFTFDVTTRLQTVYYNGILLRSRTANSSFLGMTGNFQIGSISNLTSANISNLFLGYIDELSVSGRVKPSCEILEEATLAARFNFDGSLPLQDQGPNSVPSSGSNYAIVSGRTLYGISLTSSSPSYFQATGFLPLGIPNQPFSISLWINPTSLAGTLVHRSDSSLGSGSCTSYLGFASNGSLIAQVLTNTGYAAISYANLPLATFSHIVLTWGSSNGLRLYVNNILINTQIASTSVANSTWINYVTLASCLSGCGTCDPGQISPGQFVGVVDDFRVYIREITAVDVCALYSFAFI